jgi:transposase
VGRPTKLTPEVQEKIVSLVRAGNYPEVAAQAAGISGKTYYEWMKRGESEAGIYREFRKAVKEAQAAAESHAVTVIRKAAIDGTWQAAAWFLERSKAERWRRKENVELTGKDGGPVEQRITGDTEREKVTSMIDELAARRVKKAS